MRKVESIAKSQNATRPSSFYSKMLYCRNPSRLFSACETMCLAMARDDVAAGDGAFRT